MVVLFEMSRQTVINACETTAAKHFRCNQNKRPTVYSLMNANVNTLTADI